MHQIQQKERDFHLVLFFVSFEETLLYLPPAGRCKEYSIEELACHLHCSDVWFFVLISSSASHVQITDQFPQITDRGCFNQFLTHYLHYKLKKSFEPSSRFFSLSTSWYCYWTFTAALIEILDSFKLQTSLKMKYASVSATGSGVPQQSMYQQTSRQRQ